MRLRNSNEGKVMWYRKKKAATLVLVLAVLALVFPLSTPVSSASADSSGSDVFAVGRSGTILHYEAPVAAPTITGVNPGSGKQGQTLDVVITGTNLDLAVPDFGAGITFNSLTESISTQITANITIDADAATGARKASANLNESS